MSKAANRLGQESSPYLRQHANNPVDWFPWSEEALAKARNEDKPIFLSIGYSTCHWCHVMAHESFEDEATAKLMNEGFVNIKLDREERPDLDEIYMEAVQLMTRHGGWPLSVFLTPDLKPFFGGTYFPPESKYGQPGFKDVLTAVQRYYRENKDELEARAAEIADALLNRNAGMSLAAVEAAASGAVQSVDGLAERLLLKYDELQTELYSEADKTNGGYGGAPKFPQPSKIEAQLFSREKTHQAQALLTLEKIACGGITDQLGGGVARYSVDSRWLVPHFEKMLYDNAQLLPLFAAGAAMSEATNPERSELFSDVAHQIFDYLERDLKDQSSGLYYSAEDADSEGEEGRFYVFFQDEFDEAFGDDLKLREFARAYYKVTDAGNFEGSNILTIPASKSEFAKVSEIDVSQLNENISRARKKLFEARSKRERPGLDTKCLLSWNALAVVGLLRAGLYLNETRFVERGLSLLSSLLSTFKYRNNYFHTKNSDGVKIVAFLDDVGILLQAVAEATLLTGSKALVNEARELARYIYDHYVDEEHGILYFAQKDAAHFVRPHKPEDSVIYSAQSAIFGALQSLLAWLEAKGPSDVLDAEEKKRWEALSLLCISNVSALADAAPQACAKFLHTVKWFEKMNLVSAEAAAGAVGLEPIARMTSSLVRSAHQVSVAQRSNEMFSLEHLAEFAKVPGELSVKYSLCNRSGCQLPTAKVDEILVML